MEYELVRCFLSEFHFSSDFSSFRTNSRTIPSLINTRVRNKQTVLRYYWSTPTRFRFHQMMSHLLCFIYKSLDENHIKLMLKLAKSNYLTHSLTNFCRWLWIILGIDCERSFSSFFKWKQTKSTILYMFDWLMRKFSLRKKANWLIDGDLWNKSMFLVFSWSVSVFFSW